MPEGRWLHAGCLLEDGGIFVFGGSSHMYSSYTGVSSSAIKYNPSTNTWTDLGDIRANMWSHACIALPRGKIFIGGGHSSNVAIYDLETRTAKQLIGNDLPLESYQPGCTFIGIYE